MTDLKKHTRLFNLIAPIYNIFFRSQKRNYQAVLERHRDILNLPPGARILDIGCGTGAFLACFAELGYHGTGVDVAEAMIQAARRSTSAFDIVFQQEDATKGLSFADRSFDLVISSYVLHGVNAELRKNIYREGARLSRGLILFYDYNQRRRWLTDLVEWAEGGDYFNFIRVAEQEMRGYFADVKIVNVSPHAAIYLCTPKASLKKRR